MAIEADLPPPSSYRERSYRSSADLAEFSFTVQVAESDLWINVTGAAAESALQNLAYERLLHYRAQLVAFLQRYPGWGESLKPVAVADYPLAPAFIRGMMHSAEIAGVGPMAAVAGALAEAVGRDLSVDSTGIVVENGGDIFLAGKREYQLAIFAGSSPLSGRLGVRLTNPDPFSCGVCTSSGRVGHSLSFGRADAVTIVAENSALADAVATAMANQVAKKSDLALVVDKALVLAGVTGAVAIYGDDFAAGGQLELINIEI
ncbi:MAG: UPF0280 family protein [Deltaproteobacteria bacterium]|nr:UPF0280 family protein [Deltaproteobacteria bacterium]